MRTPVIGLWMYRNDGGDFIQKKLKNKLEECGVKVINNFDMRECYCLSGRVYTLDGFDLSSVDVFYHMNLDEQTDFQNNLLRALELSGVKVINEWLPFCTAQNKFVANVLLKRHGIDVPPAAFFAPQQALAMADTIFNKWKAICVKAINRHGGKGIIYFDKVEQFKDFVESTENSFSSYYLEKIINFGAHDYRVEIFKNKVVGGYGRTKAHSFKTNISSGGSMLPLKIADEYRKIALKAAKIIDIDSTIIDMVKSIEDGKIYVLEVNCVMGIFVEAGLKYSAKVKNREVSPSYAYDNKKLNLLVNYLVDVAKH